MLAQPQDPKYTNFHIVDDEFELKLKRDADGFILYQRESIGFLMNQVGVREIKVERPPLFKVIVDDLRKRPRIEAFIQCQDCAENDIPVCKA
jgi:hypothetical protein